MFFLFFLFIIIIFLPLNDWEVDEVEDLFLRLQGIVVDTEGKDKMVWINLDNNKFSVKLLYAALELGFASSFPMRKV